MRVSFLAATSPGATTRSFGKMYAMICFAGTGEVAARRDREGHIGRTRITNHTEMLRLHDRPGRLRSWCMVQVPFPALVLSIHAKNEGRRISLRRPVIAL